MFTTVASSSAKDKQNAGVTRAVKITGRLACSRRNVKHTKILWQRSSNLLKRYFVYGLRHLPWIVSLYSETLQVGVVGSRLVMRHYKREKVKVLLWMIRRTDFKTKAKRFSCIALKETSHT